MILVDRGLFALFQSPFHILKPDRHLLSEKRRLSIYLETGVFCQRVLLTVGCP